jgi:hypothetical protein
MEKQYIAALESNTLRLQSHIKVLRRYDRPGSMPRIAITPAEQTFQVQEDPTSSNPQFCPFLNAQTTAGRGDLVTRDSVVVAEILMTTVTQSIDLGTTLRIEPVNHIIEVFVVTAREAQRCGWTSGQDRRIERIYGVVEREPLAGGNTGCSASYLFGSQQGERPQVRADGVRQQSPRGSGGSVDSIEQFRIRGQIIVNHDRPPTPSANGPRRASAAWVFNSAAQAALDRSITTGATRPAGSRPLTATPRRAPNARSAMSGPTRSQFALQ